MGANMLEMIDQEPLSRQKNTAGGFAVFYRSLREQPWYKNSEFKAVFIELVLRAQYQSTNITYKGVTRLVKRGQVFTCNQQLSNDTGVSLSQVKKAITLFKNLEQVETQKVSNKGALITLINYDKWQEKTELDEEPVESPTTEPVKPKQVKACTVISEPLLELVKELDLERQSNKANNLFVNSPLTPELAFELFWSYYPKKLGKQTAAKKFHQLFKTAKQPNGFLLQLLTNVLMRYRLEPRTWNGNSQFCLHPSTYLNQARFKDELLAQEPNNEGFNYISKNSNQPMGRATAATQSATAAFAVISQLNNS